MEKETVDKILKGGLLKDNKKTVMLVVAAVGALAAYLVGDVDLVGLIQNAVLSLGIGSVAN
jgi:hypothetical protein